MPSFCSHVYLNSGHVSGWNWLSNEAGGREGDGPLTSAEVLGLVELGPHQAGPDAIGSTRSDAKVEIGFVWAPKEAVAVAGEGGIWVVMGGRDSGEDREGSHGKA
jgi:hypothetical protein